MMRRQWNAGRAVARSAMAMILGVGALCSQHVGAETRFVSGELWQRVGHAAASNVAKDVGVGPDASFTVSDINFDSSGRGDLSAEQWLGVPLTPLSGHFHPNERLNVDGGGGARFRFTGEVFLKAGVDSFSILHDDGVILRISNLGLPDDMVLFDPLQTAAKQSPFSVNVAQSGFYPFVLDYGECCTNPEILIWRVGGGNPIQNPVPEPSSFALLAAGLIGMGALARKRTQ